jgi:hypothetical protein
LPHELRTTGSNSICQSSGKNAPRECASASG